MLNDPTSAATKPKFFFERRHNSASKAVAVPLVLCRFKPISKEEELQTIIPTMTETTQIEERPQTNEGETKEKPKRATPINRHARIFGGLFSLNSPPKPKRKAKTVPTMTNQQLYDLIFNTRPTVDSIKSQVFGKFASDNFSASDPLKIQTQENQRSSPLRGRSNSNASLNRSPGEKSGEKLPLINNKKMIPRHGSVDVSILRQQKNSPTKVQFIEPTDTSVKQQRRKVTFKIIREKEYEAGIHSDRL